MTGHLLTAAGAVEASPAWSPLEAQARARRRSTSTTPTPGCPLHHVANQARAQPVDVAVSNSFGFGGSNTCLVLRAV